MGLPGNYRRAGSGSWQGGAEASSQRGRLSNRPDAVLLAQPLLQGSLDPFHAGQVGFIDDHVRLEGPVMFVELPDVHMMHVAPVCRLAQVGGDVPGSQIFRRAFHQDVRGLTEQFQAQKGDVYVIADLSVHEAPHAGWRT